MTHRDLALGALACVTALCAAVAALTLRWDKAPTLRDNWRKARRDPLFWVMWAAIGALWIAIGGTV